MLSERTQRLDERLIWQLRAYEIDRASEEHLKPSGAGTACELRREPGLADARFSGDKDRRTAPRLRSVERTLEHPKLAYASDERLAGASLHSSQYRS
jgi:hypothetical protein